MAIEITVPRLGWSMEEGVFSGWLKGHGEKVVAGEMLFAVESDKVTMEVESLDSGTLHIPPDVPQPGAVVVVGQRLGYLLAEGEVPPVETAVAPRSGVDAAALTGSRQDERILECDTREVSASQSGTVELGVDAAALHGSEQGGIRELDLSDATGAAPASQSGMVPVTPRARRVAAELGVDASTLSGSGKGGRIRERDVREASPAPAIATLRRSIAAHMMRSHQNTAPVTLTRRADATRLVHLRNQSKAASYTDMAVKLAAIALESHPALAGGWDGDRVVLPDAIHIGIAVDTPHGLVVPVIRNVPALSLLQIAHRSRELIAAAHSRKLAAADLQGGVFTITNLGAFGIEAFTPIINYPETAVLGLGAIRWEVAALGHGQLATQQQITLSLTFDHRVVDGAPAARFLQTLAQLIESPPMTATA
jgi:pyruvate dehydrogenase E2 component (dihydrolipoamide acetyltransferase)